MPAKVIKGSELSKTIRAELKKEVEQLTQAGVRPGLAVLLVGDDPASHVYVGRKEKACADLGVYSEVYRLPASTGQEELLQRIGG